MVIIDWGLTDYKINLSNPVGTEYYRAVDWFAGDAKNSMNRGMHDRFAVAQTILSFLMLEACKKLKKTWAGSVIKGRDGVKFRKKFGQTFLNSTYARKGEWLGYWLVHDKSQCACDTPGTHDCGSTDTKCKGTHVTMCIRFQRLWSDHKDLIHGFDKKLAVSFPAKGTKRKA